MQINYKNTKDLPSDVRFPNNFEAWVNDETPIGIIYNRWKKRAHCSHCGHTWDYIETIRKDYAVYCPHCGTLEIAIPHTAHPVSSYRNFFWMWLDGESIYCVAAHSKWYNVEKNIDEIKDNLYITIDLIGCIKPDEQYAYRYIYDWKTDKRRWEKTTRMHIENHDYYSIDANINAVIEESFLKHMDIWFEHYYPNAAYWLNYLIDEMAFCARNPNVEYIKKAGLGELVECKLRKIPTFLRPNWKAKTVPQLLRLSAQDVDKLRQWEYLTVDGILRYKILKKKQNKVKKEHMKLCKQWIPDAKEFYRDHGMYGISGFAQIVRERPLKVLHYAEKQYQHNHDRNRIKFLHGDYYHQLKALEYPEDDYYLYPKNLEEAHDRISREYLDKQSEIKQRKREKQQREYEENYLPALEKYAYEDSEYLIRPLRNYKEFEAEGRNNKNCVASYYARASKGKTAVFVMRRINEPNASFVTIELRSDHNDHHVSQCFGTGNRMPAQEVRKWVNEWLENIVKPRSKKRSRKGAA